MPNSLDIAVGLSVRSKNWKNQKILWAHLRNRLITENKTNETYREFVSATKDDQLKIKDVGGYVGGYLKNGRRKPENVVSRQLLTLDIDNADLDFWLNFTLLYPNEAVLHSTHKHSPTSPRFRLIMPLSRPATPDEYEAVSRHVAGCLGIGLFDPTTFQPERLMFWPSTSTDAQYYIESQAGTWLNVDQVLASYPDWTDTSLWPTSQAAKDAIRGDVKRQQDPTEKKGLIGAFCKTYTIPEAIEVYLSDRYVTTLDPTRYTYTGGSAAAGLVVYDEKFAYSHHGTDPIGGQLCNAYDLVRVHCFGHLDKGTGTTESVRAMGDLCKSDETVKQTLAKENYESAKYDFANDYDEPEVSIDWAQDLDVDGKGKNLSNAKNIDLILKNDVCLKGVFQENDFDGKKYLIKSTPWRTISKPEPLKNVDFSGVRNYIELMYGVAAVSKIEDALNLEFERNRFHPIKEYLGGLTWDGVPRVDTLLINYFGAEDNAYTREAIRKMLVGAVARVYNPGVKFDLVLTLVGQRQGTGKSTFISKLGQSWFSDSFHTVTGKEAFEQLQGAWLIEMAELSGIRKSEVEAIKHFITKREDTYRPAYGRIPETYKRKCVFFATTNEKDFLRDPTGNRRFMPIDVCEDRITHNILDAKSLIGEEVDQVWAEAAHMYKAREPLYLSRAAEILAHAEQANHTQQDDRQGMVEAYLSALLPKSWSSMNIYERRMYLEGGAMVEKGTWRRKYVCVAEIWCECLGKDKKEMSPYNTREINAILRRLPDWEARKGSKKFEIYGTQRYFSLIN